MNMLLIAETPSASDEGHRFLVPTGSKLSESDVAKFTRAACEGRQGGNYLGVIREVEQTLANGTVRTGREVLVLVGIDVDWLEAHQPSKISTLKERLQKKLDRLGEFQVSPSDRQLTIEWPELDQWIKELEPERLPPTNWGSGPRPAQKPRKSHARRTIIGFALMSATATTIGCMYKLWTRPSDTSSRSHGQIATGSSGPENSLPQPKDIDKTKKLENKNFNDLGYNLKGVSDEKAKDMLKALLKDRTDSPLDLRQSLYKTWNAFKELRTQSKDLVDEHNPSTRQLSGFLASMDFSIEIPSSKSKSFSTPQTANFDKQDQSILDFLERYFDYAKTVSTLAQAIKKASTSDFFSDSFVKRLEKLHGSRDNIRKGIRDEKAAALKDAQKIFNRKARSEEESTVKKLYTTLENLFMRMCDIWGGPERTANPQTLDAERSRSTHEANGQTRTPGPGE